MATIADDSSHLRRVRFYRGLVPGPEEFADLQDGAYEAVRRVQARLVSSVGRPAHRPVVTVGAFFAVTVASNSGVTSDGLGVDWESALSFDARNATHGTSAGSTAPASLMKRLIIIAAGHVTREVDERTDSDGLTTRYVVGSGTEARVYALASDVDTLDTWHSVSALADLLQVVYDDGGVPLAVLERRSGTSTFSAGDVHPFDRVLYTSGLPEDELEDVREIVGRSQLATLIGDSASVVAVAVAVPTQPGGVQLVGGEQVAISTRRLGADGEFRRVKVVRVTIPATSLSLADPNTSYVVRMRLQEETGQPEVYIGEGTYPSDPYPGHFATGTPGGTGQGFRRTCIDMPLLAVQSGALSTTPTVEAIDNSPNAEFSGDSVFLVQGEDGVVDEITIAGSRILTPGPLRVEDGAGHADIDHPAVARAWARVSALGVLLDSYGVDSVVHVGPPGGYRLILSRPLVDTDAAVLATLAVDTGFIQAHASSVTEIVVLTSNAGVILTDSEFHIMVLDNP